jgi:hypothetical protein
MTTTKPTPLDHARIANIAQQIHGACVPFTVANTAKTLASEDAQSAAKAEVSLREAIMASVADLSQAGQWSIGEITAAAAKAAAMSTGTNSDKALAQFIGETKRAMDPNVRAHVPALIALRDTCWDSETELTKADKNTPAPLRKAFARKYHMLTALFGAAQDGLIMASADDVLAYAETVIEKAATNTDKVLARLAKITAELVAFHRDFPVDDIQVCVQALNDIDKKALNASRGTAVKSNVVKITTPTAPVVTSDVVAEGASNILDDMLGDDVQARAA